MPRKPFAFKQFRIEQNEVTLPVTTDACLFGAWIDLNQTASVLDLGTGTGLLLLMLAQRYPQLKGYGLELDPNTALQAAANAASSPFQDRLQITQGNWNQDLSQLAPTWPLPFDTIVCNPPFFENHQENPDPLKRQARHAAEGSLKQLLQSAAKLIKPQGRMWLLLPPSAVPSHWEGWQPISQRALAPHPQKEPHLYVLELGLAGEHSAEALLLDTHFTYESPGCYSPETKALLKEFYLAF
ncbi:MAG: tRNA1(Val) (adenine(37)-N6)-methyltransferase [Bacteroidia bacterium]